VRLELVENPYDVGELHWSGQLTWLAR
jgi:hypothetical protein